MRALLDTNIFVSYLLTPNPESPVVRIVEAGLDGVYTLLIPEQLVEELTSRVETKLYLQEHISKERLGSFVDSLLLVGESIPTHEEVLEVSRDPKDDYLLAAAAIGDADFLVTGDFDILSIQEPAYKKAHFLILSPTQFIEVLSAVQKHG